MHIESVLATDDLNQNQNQPRVCVQSIQPTIRKLNNAGIGAILDYAAENDVHS